jgi:hypothetical protein
MGTALSAQRSYAYDRVGYGEGMCVASKHGLFIDSCVDRLYMHSLADGSLVRRVGSTGSGKGQFDFGAGGLCVSPDGDSVLVAESHNNRVQELRIVDGSWVRFVGEGVLDMPGFVDCNANVIAVSESCHRISVLSWVDGSVRAQFGSYGRGLGQLNYPRGVRLLADGSGLVVADSCNSRLCVFTLRGGFVAAIGGRKQGLYNPRDVLECALDGSFLVTTRASHNLIKFSRVGVKVGVYKAQCGATPSELTELAAMAALPGGGILVRDCCGRQYSILCNHCHRLQWIGLCLYAARV